jgi:nucleotide-binding universal stress UspA family protein
MDQTSSARRIVVGVDGSPSSIDALRWAAKTSQAFGAEIDAIMTWEYPAAFGMGPVPSEWSPLADAESSLAKALVEAFGNPRPDGLRARVVHGYAPKILIDESVGAEMLVVGSRGHGGFAGLLLGSVSAHCAEHASCPVVVVHTQR